MTLSWADYNYAEEPIGGTVNLPAAEVGAIHAWLTSIPAPSAHPNPISAERSRRFELDHAAVRAQLYSGLPDEIKHGDYIYRLWARDNAIGLYGPPHASADNSGRRLLRAAGCSVSICGRPQSPDRNGQYPVS